MSESTGSQNSHSKLGAVERSMLEYVLASHMQYIDRRASVLSLLLHSHLLARGARPVSSVTAVIDNESFRGDPIRLSYALTPRPGHESLSCVTCQLQLSVAETDSQIFVNLTDASTDKFGHLELSGVEHIRLESGPNDPHVPLTVSNTFPLLDTLLDMIEKDLMSPVLPTPPLNRSTELDRKQEKTYTTSRPNEETSRTPYTSIQPQGRTGFLPVADPMSTYGRSDLDPLGGRGGAIGGMLLDPRRLPVGSGPMFGGPDLLPPGSVPPGARFDPFGPGVIPPRPSNTPRNPDPDHALPPGYDDMYL